MKWRMNVGQSKECRRWEWRPIHIGGTEVKQTSKQAKRCTYVWSGLVGQAGGACMIGTWQMKTPTDGTALIVSG